VESLRLLESRGQLLSRVAHGLEDEFGVITDLDAGMKRLHHYNADDPLPLGASQLAALR